MKNIRNASGLMDIRLLSAPAFLWLLMLVLWVGAHLASLFLFLPMLVKTGLAPLLVQEINGQLRPALLVLTLMCLAVQFLLLWRAGGASFVRDVRSILLLASGLLALVLLLPQVQESVAGLVPRFLYGGLLGCGLLLLSQPLPSRS